MVCIHYILCLPLIIVTIGAALRGAKVVEIDLEQICPTKLVIFSKTGQNAHNNLG
jgi:hypothetical protein